MISGARRFGAARLVSSRAKQGISSCRQPRERGGSSLQNGFFCPSGSRQFGPCASPRAAARDSSGRDPAARLAAVTLAVPLAQVRPSLGASVSRRRSARRVPAASGAIAASPDGRNLSNPTHAPPTRPPPERNQDSLSSLLRRSQIDIGWGALESAPRVRCGYSSGAHGHRAGGPRWGVADAASCGQRGTPPRAVQARSCAEESPSAARGGAPARSAAAPEGQEATTKLGKSLAVPWLSSPRCSTTGRKPVQGGHVVIETEYNSAMASSHVSPGYAASGRRRR